MKKLLIIVNIIGAVCMVLALALPFTKTTLSDGEMLVVFLMYLLMGFGVWYISAKALEDKA
jgi:1,4-dihydroxy-2-naphthoate octaprenyltransferase